MKSNLKLPGTWIKLAALVAQLSLSISSVHASEFLDSKAAASDDSAEVQLLTGLISLEGQKLSGNELANQAQAVFAHYDQTATAQGRDERLAHSLVDLNVMTPAQADLFKSEVQASLQSKLAGLQQSSPKELQQQMAAAVFEAIRGSGQGAQFSACEVGESLVFYVGAIIGLYYANTDLHGLGRVMTNFASIVFIYLGMGGIADGICTPGAT